MSWSACIRDSEQSSLRRQQPVALLLFRYENTADLKVLTKVLRFLGGSINCHHESVNMNSDQTRVFRQILQACKPKQLQSISKPYTVWYLATANDTNNGEKLYPALECNASIARWWIRHHHYDAFFTKLPARGYQTVLPTLQGRSPSKLAPTSVAGT